MLYMIVQLSARSPFDSLLVSRCRYDLRTTSCGVDNRVGITASLVGGTSATSAFDVLHLEPPTLQGKRKEPVWSGLHQRNGKAASGIHFTDRA
jgi:hypothetical protein